MRLSRMMLVPMSGPLPANGYFGRTEMREMEPEAFSLFPWWVYAITVAGGIGFGCLQFIYLQKAIEGRAWLLAVKLLLWLAAMALVALISVPLLLFFVSTATLTLFYRLWRLWRATKAKLKDADALENIDSREEENQCLK